MCIRDRKRSTENPDVNVSLVDENSGKAAASQAVQALGGEPMGTFSAFQDQIPQSIFQPAEPSRQQVVGYDADDCQGGQVTHSSLDADERQKACTPTRTPNPAASHANDRNLEEESKVELRGFSDQLIVSAKEQSVTEQAANVKKKLFSEQ